MFNVIQLMHKISLNCRLNDQTIYIESMELDGYVVQYFNTALILDLEKVIHKQDT